MATGPKEVSHMPISNHNIENVSVKEEKRQKKTSREVEIQTDASTMILLINERAPGKLGVKVLTYLFTGVQTYFIARKAVAKGITSWSEKSFHKNIFLYLYTAKRMSLAKTLEELKNFGTQTAIDGKINEGRRHVEIFGLNAEIQKSPANPFNMTARNFPRRHRNYLRTSSSNRTRASSFSPGKALDLVRAALQPSLNADLENVLKSYQELFKLAAVNIKENTGEVVSDEQVNMAIRKALEEAKFLFRTDSKPIIEKPERETRIGSPIVRKKRRPRDTTKDDGVSPAKSSRPEKNVHYEWDPDCINYETEFVMGVKANKALGFAATRGKLYYRHPDLFRYIGDQEDKQWLYENGHLPITGGKAFLMIKDNIHDIALNHDDYKIPKAMTTRATTLKTMSPCHTLEVTLLIRNSENTNLEDIQGFKVSKRMVEKMKAVMRKSQIHRDKDSKKDTTQTEPSKEKKVANEQTSETITAPPFSAPLVPQDTLTK